MSGGATQSRGFSHAESYWSRYFPAIYGNVSKVVLLLAGQIGYIDVLVEHPPLDLTGDTRDPPPCVACGHLLRKVAALFFRRAS